MFGWSLMFYTLEASAEIISHWIISPRSGNLLRGWGEGGYKRVDSV